MNHLYYGDNLDIMRGGYIPNESVDLIYFDPPFNSNASYNIFFQEQDGTQSQSQITAFEDTWRWNEKSEKIYREIFEKSPVKLTDLLRTLRSVLGQSNMMTYLVMMAVRLVEMYQLLKSTGSIYLHCDPTASHYLKLILDTIFGMDNFKNEIIWKRKTGKGATQNKQNKYGTCTDILLFYSKSSKNIFNPQFNLDAPGYQEYVNKFFIHTDEKGRRYRIADLSSPSPRPSLVYEYKGYKPPKYGWAISRKKMEMWDEEGKLYFPKKENGRIRRKIYLDESQGRPVQNLWDDIKVIGSQSSERLGYPTQKPESLLERVIKASSNEGDVVFDPFCGCGTTIIASERLRRQWIGIDISHLAINLIKNRLKDAFASELSHYEVVGEPKCLSDAKALAEDNRYEFEWWALSMVQARPAQDKKKGADKGIDGYIYFIDTKDNKDKKIVLQVKSGKIKRDNIAALRGDMEREEAIMGVLLTLQEPSQSMKEEAISAGFYVNEFFPKEKFPRIQILTIQQLFDGAAIRYPRLASETTFKKAERKRKNVNQDGLW